MAFIGEYQCKVDPKGRVMFPSALKKQMPEGANEQFVVKRDLFEKCLVMYPMYEWERQYKLIQSNLNPFNRDHNRFLREFHKGAIEVSLDGTGRFLIPKRLLDFANIEKDAMLLGEAGKIEIWAEGEYNATQTNTDDLSELAENVMGNINLQGL